MPSGLLQGKGCRDSFLRAEDDSALFLSIRNHQTPFLIQQRQERAKKNIKTPSEKNLLEEKVKSQFSTGGLPVVRSLSKYLFLILVFPFHFILFRLPQMAAAKIFKPLANLIKMVLDRVIPPIVKVCNLIYTPIKNICLKVLSILHSLFLSVKAPIIKVLHVVNSTLSTVNKTVIAPPKKILGKIFSTIGNFLSQMSYKIKVASMWIKLLATDGINYVRNIGVNDQPSTETDSPKT